MDIKKKLAILFKSRAGIIWLQTNEEVRAERTCISVAAGLSTEINGDRVDMNVYIWRSTIGLVNVKGELVDREAIDPRKLTNKISNDKTRAMYIIEDLSSLIRDPFTMRSIKDLARDLGNKDPSNAKMIVVIDSKLPPDELKCSTIVVDFPLPTKEEIGIIIEDIVKIMDGSLSEDQIKNIENQKDSIITALTGLEAEKVALAINESLVRTKGKIDIALLIESKKSLISGGAITWHDPDPRGLDAIGGLDELVSWLIERREAFSSEAEEYGLPRPKGILVVGVPGTGKSLTAKIISTVWGMPLLRFDVGAVFSKYVGTSEENIRSTLGIAEAISPTILWIDEIEKAFTGLSSEGDGGTAARVFGTFLTWLQESDAPVFIIATANDIEKLPPEFTRAGRFDCIWWVDTPNCEERKAISKVMRNKYKKTAAVSDDEVSAVTEGYTGAEIEEAYKNALNIAFNDGRRDVVTSDVIESIKKIVPIIKSSSRRIGELRKWADGSARLANAQDDKAVSKTSSNTASKLEI